MHQTRCIELAREAAVACGERHDYMPATELLAETWQPHRWVIDAMLMAAHEAELERDQYRAGNTTLLRLLMQYSASVAGTDTEAEAVLKQAGLVKDDGALDWQALADREPKPIPWEQAVNECITDPDVRARLLAMKDET